MKYVSPLSEVELSTLRTMYKFHPLVQVRSRAHGILLGHRGFRLQEIATILFLTRQSISIFFDAWESIGLAGLYDKLKSGRPRSLSSEEETFIGKAVRQEPRSIKRVLALLAEQSHKWISPSTLKRILNGGVCPGNARANPSNPNVIKFVFDRPNNGLNSLSFVRGKVTSIYVISMKPGSLWIPMFLTLGNPKERLSKFLLRRVLDSTF